MKNPLANAHLKFFRLALFLLTLSGIASAQTTCMVYCPDGSRPIISCSSNVDPCTKSSSSSSSSSASGASAAGAALGDAIGKALGCAIFGGPGCPDKNAGRRALALQQNNKGVEAWKKGDWATAAAFFQQALQNSPNDAVIHQNLANARANLATVAQQERDRAQRELADKQRERKVAADNMRQSIQGFAKTLNAAPSQGGLDFGTSDSGTPSGGVDFQASAVGNGSGAATSGKQAEPTGQGFGINGLPGIYVGGPQDGKCAGSLCGNSTANSSSSSALAAPGGEIKGIPGLPGINLAASDGNNNSATQPLDAKIADAKPAVENTNELDFQSVLPEKAAVSTDSIAVSTPQQMSQQTAVSLPVQDSPLSAVNVPPASSSVTGTDTKKVDPPSLQRLQDQANVTTNGKTLEDLSANARSGFDTPLRSPALPVGLSSSSPRDVVQSDSNLAPPKPAPTTTLGTYNMPPQNNRPPVIASAVHFSNPSAVVVPSLSESDFLFSLQTGKLTPMADGGHPIDALGSSPPGLHGLVGGTTWTYGFKWPHLNCGDQCQKEIKKNLDRQLALFCSSQSNLQECLDAGLPFTPDMYDVVVSMGSSHSAIDDLATRVIFDGASFGEYSRQNKEIFASLKGRDFDTLDCHSNGAMLCLAALRSGDTHAKEVRLFGPQMNPEAAKRWQEYAANTGTTIKIFINNGDPVAALSWKQPTPQTPIATAATAVWLTNPVTGPPAFADALLNAYFDSKSGVMDSTLKNYGFEVTRFYCKQSTSAECQKCTDTPSIACHSMKLYERNVGVIKK
ncbi:MAG: hypothetical protein JWO13_3780 [Acidobacteriales bacterium]|nr:hypothetical protein [Terriglobales bacterium]